MTGCAYALKYCGLDSLIWRVSHVAVPGFSSQALSETLDHKKMRAYTSPPITSFLYALQTTRTAPQLCLWRISTTRRCGTTRAHGPRCS